ncbi:MAG TPA: gliding motility-associated C-terminal domain-containing protein, partial [Bacteroidia bacterium]|nr:gliding motility-associated C-terminal domain-containing protein [Bacteroidia bacterium]
YNYVWNTVPVQTNSLASGLSAGNYSVTVTDSSGCSSTVSANIMDPPVSITANCIVSGTSSCQGGNNSAIQAVVTGGNSPFTYQWNTGATTSILNGSSAGTYTVTVIDAGGCSTVASGVITPSPGAVSATISTPSNIACYGQSTGSINLAVSGGIPPYTFQWSNGSTSQNLNNLTSGIYTVTISDNNGCSTTTSTSLLQPAQPLQINMNSISDVSCFGGEDGSISVGANGGTQPYTYNWSNGNSTQSPINLSAGMYIVTVTDMNGCNSLMSFTVSQPSSPLTILPVSVVDVSCLPGSTGSIDINASGGTGPYNYLWNTGLITEDLTNLQPGNYSVTVTDNNGCTGISSFTITDHSSTLTTSVITSQNVLCFNGSNGFIDIDVNGGQSPYIYQWSNGMTTQDISSLSSGTYSVIITDSNGCTSTISVVIQQPALPLIPQIQLLNPVNCNGGINGTLSLIITGGTSPFTYLWSNGSTTLVNSGLTAGVYTVTITDANGCNAIISDSISQPANAMTVLLNAVAGNACDSMQVSSITPQVSGGVTPYNYVWNTGATTPQISGISAGVYTVSVTDSIGCTVVSSIQAQGTPDVLQISSAITQPNCISGQMGSITVNVSGGLPGYTFSWNTGASSSNIEGLPPGIYSVTITDSNGSFITANFEIEDHSSVSLHLDGPSTICVGDMATLTADSIPGFSYQWYYGGIPLNGATTNSFSTPAAGVYSVAVTSACGTFMSNQIEIIVKSIENVSVSNHQIICPPEQVQLFAAGGVTYQWTPTTNITFSNVPDPIVNPTVSTTYTVTITNEFGCKTNLHVEVGVMCDSLLVPNAFSPNGDGTNDGYVIDGIENYPGNKLWVYSRWGNLVYKAKDYRNNWDGTSNVSGVYMGKKVQTGTYYFILDLNDGSKPKTGYLIIRR